jgi:hypothetical protein
MKSKTKYFISLGNPVIITNISVCLLYLGRLKDAIANLESNLTANPALFLQVVLKKTIVAFSVISFNFLIIFNTKLV